MRKIAIEMTKEELKRRRDLGKRSAELRREAAFDIDEIASAYYAYSTLRLTSAMRADISEDDVKNALLSYQNALKKYGYSENDFEYVPSCPICKDTGSVDGKMCSCIREIYIKKLGELCEIERRAPFTFDDSDLGLVKDEGQKEALQAVYNFAKKYADRLPNVKLKNILFSGTVGTGKSCLASAIARRVVQRGYAAYVMSAFEFNNKLLECHLAPAAAKASVLEYILTADLLVIDDLATEPMLKNVTAEYLLLVLDERQRRGLSTIITTNFDQSKLAAHYGERILSRLIDKNSFRSFYLSGNDLRKP